METTESCPEHAHVLLLQALVLCELLPETTADALPSFLSLMSTARSACSEPAQCQLFLSMLLEIVEHDEEELQRDCATVISENEQLENRLARQATEAAVLTHQVSTLSASPCFAELRTLLAALSLKQHFLAFAATGTISKWQLREACVQVGDLARLGLSREEKEGREREEDLGR